MLCLTVWIVIKHFREPAMTIWRRDCFTVLIKNHMSNFMGCVHNVSVVLFSTDSSSACVSIFTVSCFNIGYLSTTLSAVHQSTTDLCMRTQFTTATTGSIFPRNSDISWSSCSHKCFYWDYTLFVMFENITLSSWTTDTGITMTLISFQECMHVPTSSSM